MDLEAARIAMIDSQVRVNDVTDRRLISAMIAVPREVFVPAAKRASAYADIAVETRPGRWMAAARDFSKLLNIAAVRPPKIAFSISHPAQAIRVLFSPAWPPRSLRWRTMRPVRNNCAMALTLPTRPVSRLSRGR